MSTPALGARRRAACDVKTAAPKRRKTPRPPPPQKKRAAQTLLDLGQRSLGRRAECARCGLLYVVGDAADEAAHARRCDAFRRGAPAARLERADARVAADVDDRTRVVEVRPTDARSLRAVVREARRTAARDLGAPTDDGGGGEDDAATAYVAVARGRAVGLCLVEPVPGAPARWAWPRSGSSRRGGAAAWARRSSTPRARASRSPGPCRDGRSRRRTGHGTGRPSSRPTAPDASTRPPPVT